MYKLLLVDDRIDIIETIEKVIDWSALGIMVVGKAINGAEALEIVKKKSPHIVITDIRMPIMDGLELTEKIRELGKEVEIVILSGYDEFNYAKQAMQLGVKDYLLKPVKIDKIIELVTKIIKDMDKKKQYDSDYKRLKERAVKGEPLLQAEYFSQLIKNPMIDRVTMGEKLQELGINVDFEGFRIIILSWDDTDREDGLARQMGYELINFAAINIMEEILGDDFKKVMFRKDNQIISIINGLDGREEAKGIAREWRKNINSCLQHCVTIGIGKYYRESTDIVTSYNEAKKAIESNFILGKNNIIYIDDISKEYPVDFKYPFLELNNLLQYIKIGLIKQTKETYKKFIKNFYIHNTLSSDEIKKYLIGSITVFYNGLIDEGIELHEVVGSQADIFKKLEVTKSLEELDAVLEGILLSIAKYISKKNEEKEEDQIHCIIKYINDNYQNPELSLNEISGRFFTSTSRLSVLLKEYLGETFSEYIRNMRMEKAKIMLSIDESKVYEIAESVGYTDRRHFSDVFKKYTGMTPKQYTEKYRNQ